MKMITAVPTVAKGWLVGMDTHQHAGKGRGNKIINGDGDLALVGTPSSTAGAALDNPYNLHQYTLGNDRRCGLIDITEVAVQTGIVLHHG